MRVAMTNHEFKHGGLVFSISTTDDARLLLSAGGDALNLWNLETKERVWCAENIGIGNHIAAAISADGKAIVSVGEDYLLRVWTPNDLPPCELSLPDYMNNTVHFVPGQDKVVVGNGYGRVYSVDLNSRDVQLLHAEHEIWISSLRVTPDGRFVASTSSENCVGRVYDLHSECLVFEDVLRGGAFPAVDVSPNGEIVFVSPDGAPMVLSCRPVNTA
jgi:WD40 repeat protein